MKRLNKIAERQKANIRDVVKVFNTEVADKINHRGTCCHIDVELRIGYEEELGTDVGVEVNWSTAGAQTPDKAIEFANELLKAAKLAKNFRYNGYEATYEE